jgi:hypothetical protein
MLIQMLLKLMRMIYRLVIVDVYLKNKKNMTFGATTRRGTQVIVISGSYHHCTPVHHLVT